ncbi:hypothetical protein EJB05_38547, partial [Eragrostis curvula]
MKLQCDECAAAAATVFCSNDEAALCYACDHRVHRANKLAGKHQRFSLLHPSPSSSSSAQKPPVCDICQDRRGLFFCKEDRAIFCRECDVTTHTANELTRRHSRFLLTGVRVSSEPVDYAAVPEKEAVEGGKVQIGGLLQEACPAWAGPEQVLSGVVVTADERASRERCVPQMQMHAEWTGSKRPRASAPCSYW